MERWLGTVGPRADLLRAALTELNRHEAQLPPLVDYFKMDYFLFQKDRDGRPPLPPPGPASETRAADWLLALAGRAPWEEQRETRLVHSLAAQALERLQRPLWERPAEPEDPRRIRPVPFGLEMAYFFFLQPSAVERMRRAEARGLCDLRGTRLQVALALYQAEKGKPAPALDALVPEYLPAVPVDPYSGLPFHYRVSKGEEIETGFADPVGEVPAFRKVAPGQGIVWSVGPDGADQGGKRDGAYLDDAEHRQWAIHGFDRVFIVPRTR
jgi:hypothetical protein